MNLGGGGWGQDGTGLLWKARRNGEKNDPKLLIVSSSKQLDISRIHYRAVTVPTLFSEPLKLGAKSQVLTHS